MPNQVLEDLEAAIFWAKTKTYPAFPAEQMALETLGYLVRHGYILVKEEEDAL